LKLPPRAADAGDFGLLTTFQAKVNMQSVDRSSKGVLAMKMQSTVVSKNIARVQSAAKSGLLGRYAPAKALQAANTPAPQSWGPAMRR
jgi:hypothetical protein